LLADEDFDVRDRATADLIAAGRVAVPLLRAALEGDDKEQARRAQECLRVIETGAERPVVAAAARALAVRRPPGADAVLLAYLPHADGEAEPALREALAAVGNRGGGPGPVLRAALADRDPSRRVAAAFAVGRCGPEGRRLLPPLLNDADDRV